MNYLSVLNLFFDVSLLLKFWTSGFCWRTLYIKQTWAQKVPTFAPEFCTHLTT